MTLQEELEQLNKAFATFKDVVLTEFLGFVLLHPGKFVMIILIVAVTSQLISLLI